MFGKRTPGQAPTGPSWLRGDVEPAAQSHKDARLIKSSEINNMWQIGASVSDKKVRQDDDMSERWALKPEVLLNMSNISRKRVAGDNEAEAMKRKNRTIAWMSMGAAPEDPDQDEDSESESEVESLSEYEEEDCQDCGSTLEYHEIRKRMQCRTCEWWPDPDDSD